MHAHTYTRLSMHLSKSMNSYWYLQFQYNTMPVFILAFSLSLFVTFLFDSKKSTFMIYNIVTCSALVYI